MRRSGSERQFELCAIGYYDVVGVTSAFSDIRLNAPQGLYLQPANHYLYIADRNNGVVRLLNDVGVLTTYAGNGTTNSITGMGGLASSAGIGTPTGLVKDVAGNLYIETQASGVTAVLQVSTSGIITSPYSGSLNGAGQVAVTSDGSSLYIADYYNGRVLTVPTAGGVMTTFVATGAAGLPSGYVYGVAVEASYVYFSDYYNHKVYKAPLAGGSVAVVAGTGTPGFNGDETDATMAQLNNPAQLYLLGGFLYFADKSNHRIRKINLSTGQIETVAGSTSGGFSGDGDLAIVAKVELPVSSGRG